MSTSGRIFLCFNLFLLIFNQECSAYTNGTIMFDLDGTMNKTLLESILTWYKKEFSYISGVRDGKFNLTDFPSIPLYSSNDDLGTEKSNIENENTLITIGRKTYYGLELSKMKVGTSFTNFYMKYLPVFEFPFSVQVEIIRRVHTHVKMSEIHGGTGTLFVMENMTVSPHKPWIKIDLMTKMLEEVSGSIRFILYQNNSDEITNRIRDDGIYDIVTMVNSEAAAKVLSAAEKRNLFRWRRRWIIFLPSMSKLDIHNVGFNERSENITVIQFANADKNTTFPLKSSLSCVLFDAIGIVLKLLNQLFIGIDSSTIENVNGKTGNFTIDFSKLKSNSPTEVCKRDTWIMHVYHGLGKYAKLVGNFSGLANGSNTVMNLPKPRLKNVTTESVLEDLKYKPFRVITIIEKPFVQYKANASAYKHTKDKLEGFVIDILKALMRRINITYNIELDPSGKYGTLQSDGHWNGMISRVMNGRADLAAQAFSITAERKRAVDFLQSFLGFKGAILLKDDSNEGALQEMFQFLRPFDLKLWGLTMGAMLITAIILAILHCAVPNKTNYNLYESLFSILGSLFQGVMTASPSRISSQIIVCIWWFFSLMIVVTYIGNYGALRSQADAQSDIAVISEILTQNKYQYGTVKDTAYDSLLKTSSLEFMQKMNKMIRLEFKDGLVNSTEYAIKLVKKGRYAFIWDNMITRYYAYRECLKSTAEFNQYYYGFIIPKNSDFKDLFDKTLITMRGEGELDEILDKYPYLNGVSTNETCDYAGFLGSIRQLLPRDILKFASSDALTLEQTLGIFLIMIAGCIFSLIVAVIECTYLRLYHKRITQQSTQNVGNGRKRGESRA